MLFEAAKIGKGDVRWKCSNVYVQWNVVVVHSLSRIVILFSSTNYLVFSELAITELKLWNACSLSITMNCTLSHVEESTLGNAHPQIHAYPHCSYETK
jgi:hypothetical protein